jgi:hypothetical protein
MGRLPVIDRAWGGSLALAVLLAFGAVVSAAAQGPPPGAGRPADIGSRAPGAPPRGMGRGDSLPTPSFVQPAPAETFRPRLFGAWVDNADVLPRGDVWASFYASRWQAASSRGVDVSLADVSAGLARGVQVGFSIPYSFFTADGFDTARGVGDAYLSAKLRLARSEDGRTGVAVSPALEFLSDSSVALGYRRVNLVLPVSAHLDRGPVRVTGTGGYFTRGSLFGSGSVEVGLGPRAGIGATLTHAYSTEDNPLEGERAGDRRRTDIGGSVYVVASRSLIVFAGLGRTIGARDASLAATVVSGGLTVNLARSVANPFAPSAR